MKIDILRMSIPNEAIQHVYNTHAYKIFRDYKSWDEAKEECERLGGHLITITSEEEQRYIETYIRELVGETEPRKIWIGCTDEGHEGDWRWCTGEPFEYNNWGTRQPDDLNGQNHAIIQNYVIIRYNIEQFGWDDIDQNDENNIWYICEWDYI